MKKLLFLCTALVGVMFLTSSCSKDEYTEKDAERARMVQLTVIVKDINNQSTLMDNFEISSPQTGEIIKGQTTQDGWVNVLVKEGTAALRIKKEGYATAIAVVNNINGQSAVTVVPMFSNKQSNDQGTITGTVKANTDFTKSYYTLSPVKGAKISLAINPNSLQGFASIDSELAGFVPAAISYDDSTLMQPTITNESGVFSIKVPITTTEISYTVNVSEAPVDMTAYYATTFSEAVSLRSDIKGYVSTSSLPGLNKYAVNTIAQYVVAGPSTAAFSGINIVLPNPTAGGTPAPGKTASFSLSAADYITTEYTLAKAEIVSITNCYSFTEQPVVSYNTVNLIPGLTMNTRPQVEVVMDGNKFVTAIKITDAGKFTLSRDGKQMPNQKNSFVINTFEKMVALNPTPTTREIAEAKATVNIVGANAVLDINVSNAGKGYSAIPNVLLKLRKKNGDGTYSYRTYTAADFGATLVANNGISLTASVDIEGFAAKADIIGLKIERFKGGDIKNNANWENVLGGDQIDLYIKTYDDNTAFNDNSFNFKAEMKSTSTMSNITTSIIDGGQGFVNGSMLTYKVDNDEDGVAVPGGRVIAHATANVDANGAISSISSFTMVDGAGWDGSIYPTVLVEVGANLAAKAYVRAVVDPKTGSISGLSAYDEATGVWSAPATTVLAGHGYVTAPGVIVPTGVNRRPAKINTSVSGGQLQLTVADTGEEYPTNITSGPSIFTNMNNTRSNVVVTNGHNNHNLDINLMPHTK